MNDLEELDQSYMSIQSVADILDKDESTIRKIGKDLFPASFQNGIKTLLTEAQVTAIKLNLGKNSELPKTELEKALIIIQAIGFLNETVSNLQARLNEAQPKIDFFDAVVDSKTAISMGDVAKVLDIGVGRNTMFSRLREHGVLDGRNIPYQKYIDAEWFRVIEQKYTVGAETMVNIKTLVYQKGLNGIRRLLA